MYEFCPAPVRHPGREPSRAIYGRRFRDGVPVVVTRWYGTFLVDGETVVRSALPPEDPESLADRARRRREGQLTPEEDAILAHRGPQEWSTGDRRLAEHGLRLDGRATDDLPTGTLRPPAERLRPALLLAAQRALDASWDPSVHVEEAVRAAADLDRVRNLVGERLASWVARDSPEVDASDHAGAVRAAMEGSGEPPLGPGDPNLREARRRLAELYRAVEAAHAELEGAVAAAAPRRAPNLSSLLGPDLTARLLAQAGGLERLARLPSSTVQVLGAERAFFEHLRGRAPPPRHGLLFLHPAIQSAPRAERGKLARALAGKVAIAARLDREGSPVDPSLGRAFDQRRAAITAQRGAKRRRPRGGSG
jgi:nucleolar protein 56